MGNDNAPTYVKVVEITSDRTDADPQLQKSMPQVMTKAVCDYLKKAKGITTSNKDQQEGAVEFHLRGTLTSLALEKKAGKDSVTCEVKIMLTEMPSGALANFKGGAYVPLGVKRDAKQIKSAAEECVIAATEDKIEKVL